MWKDDAYLLDILLAARKVVKFTRDVSEEEFRRDELLQQALMRLIQIMGEAARKVSQETKDSQPEIPWAEMVGMRHRLVHEYFRIRVDRVWEAVQKDVPKLIRLIEPLVPPPDAQE